MSGIGHAAKVLQGYVGAAVDGEIGPQTIAATANADDATLINQISDERIAFMQQSPVWPKYGKGWTARVQRVRAAALAMASAAPARRSRLRHQRRLSRRSRYHRRYRQRLGERR